MACIGLSIWLSTRQVFDATSSGDISTDPVTGQLSTPTFSQPSAWGTILEAGLGALGVALIALAVVAVGGIIASLVVDDARRARTLADLFDDEDEHEDEDTEEPTEVVDSS